MTTRGGSANWEVKLSDEFLCLNGYTMFDTGADNNFVYSWFLDDMLREVMDIYMVEIEESVGLGDQQTKAKLERAVILKVAYRDPTSNDRYEGTHVFRVIEQKERPKYGTPFVVGVRTICSYYLPLMLRILRHNHAIMRKGLPYEQSLEEELRGCRVKIRPKLLPMRKKELLLLEDQSGDQEQFEILNEIKLMEDQTKKQEKYWEAKSNQMNVAACISTTSTIFNEADGQMEAVLSFDDAIEKRLSFDDHRKYIQILYGGKLLDEGHLSTLVYPGHIERNECDWDSIIRERKNIWDNPEERVPCVGTWLDTLSPDSLLHFWYCDRQNGIYDRYLEELEQLGQHTSKFSKMMKEPVWNPNNTIEELDWDDYIKDLRNGDAVLDAYSERYIEAMHKGGLTLAEYLEWQEKEITLQMFREDRAELENGFFGSMEKKFDIDKYYEDTVSPWTHTLGESPEERDSYIPDGNSGIYNWLSTTREEALDKYEKDARKNTSSEIWSSVEEILMSERCKRVFCPVEWTGMRGIDPIKLQFTDEWEAVKQKGMRPKGTKAFVNAKMTEAYEKEFRRMKKYMYQDSTSSTASRMLVADKATPPYVRICGDYRDVNKFIKIPQHYIPNIRHEIEKARGYKYYLNIDLANGYHNLPIDEEAQKALALHTQFGLVQPKFMPEGVRSAPQEFQRIMRQVFAPMVDNNDAIVIWDNILVLCNTVEEIVSKLNQVLDICEKHNIILKMAKTEIGYTEASFFGYTVSQDTVELSQDRKDGVKALKFFKNKKGAQSFLGSCNFFKDFVPNYAKYAAALQDMTKNTFNWDRTTWEVDYEQEFESLKDAIQGAMKLHYPDYNKLWIMRTDCSKDALGVVLFQVGDDGVYEPIAFHSQKLSDQAHNWAAVKLEAYAVYYGVKKLSYYLQGKAFVIEVDHANLVTMQNSEQAIIQRWRSYLENYDFRIKHIAGKQNLIADFQSRMYNILPFADDNIEEDEDINDEILNIYQQRCTHEEDTLGRVCTHYGIGNIHELNLDNTPSKLEVHIRDPTTTTIVECMTSDSLNTVFAMHEPLGLYSYMYQDYLLDGRDSLGMLQTYGNLVTIDAVAQAFGVRTRSGYGKPVNTVSEAVLPSKNPPSKPHLEIECKFRMTAALQQYLDHRQLQPSIKTFTDIYFDTSEYYYTQRDIWIRQRGNKFEIKYPAPQGHNGGIRSYLELTADQDILNFLHIVDNEQLPMSAVFHRNGLTAFAQITTTRATYNVTLPITTSPTNQHVFKLDIDSAVLECQGAISNYDVAELELAHPTEGMTTLDIFHDIMNQLSIDSNCLQQSLNGKLVEALLRHNKPHYDLLALKGIVTPIDNNFSASGGEKEQYEQQNTTRGEKFNEDFADINDADFGDDLVEHIKQLQLKVKAAMEELHGSRQLHYGADRMYKDACLRFPGHRIPQVYFKDYVSKCAGCQKSRLQKDKLFIEQVRTLKANARPRSAVCIDRVSITPSSKSENKTAIVIADLFTRLVRVYPVKEYDSASVANSLKDFLITYGAYDVVQSDPGSDILGGAVDAINRRWKMDRKISLVDRHESNGNERLIQEILRHLRTLVNDERAMELWDTPDYIGFVTFCINNQVNRETGLAPFIATFGDRDKAFFELPEVDQYATKSSKAYVENLNKSLELVRQINAEYQKKIHEERISKTPSETHNQFRAGDLIWFRRKERIDKDGKLYSRNKGPYRVISMRRNDVKCEHIVNKKEKTFHVSDVMPVNLDTPYDDLYEAAKRDSNEYEVLRVVNFRGDPMKRSDGLEFLIHYEGDEQASWTSWTADLMLNDKIKEFCKEHKCLEVLLMTAVEATKLVSKLRWEQIKPEEAKIGDTCYVDLKNWSIDDGGLWFESLGLPQPYEKRYVVKGEYKKATVLDKGRQIGIYFPIFDQVSDQNKTFVRWYGQERILTDEMILVDEDFIMEYPKILEKLQKRSGSKVKLLKKDERHQVKVGTLLMKKYDIQNDNGGTESYVFYGPLKLESQQGQIIKYRHLDIPTHEGFIQEWEVELESQSGVQIMMRKQLSDSCPLRVSIKGYEGDIDDRETLIFMVKFHDKKSFEFMNYNKDLSLTKEFKEFCSSRKALTLIGRSIDEAKSLDKLWQNLLVTGTSDKWVQGNTIYMDIRALGNYKWYRGTKLPHYQSKVYIIKGIIKKILDGDRSMQVKFDVYTETYTFRSKELIMYAYREFDESDDVFTLIDSSNATEYYSGIF